MVTTETTVQVAWGWVGVEIALAVAILALGVALGVALGLWIAVHTGVLPRAQQHLGELRGMPEQLREPLLR